MGDGMSDSSSICATDKCGNVTRGGYAHCLSCRRAAQAQALAAKTQAATEILRQLTQNSTHNGDSSMTNNTKKSQASVMLVFPGPDERRYRIVSFVGEVPRHVLKYVLDEEREDNGHSGRYSQVSRWVKNEDQP
jgi:hypothetical protein